VVHTEKQLSESRFARHDNNPAHSTFFVQISGNKSRDLAPSLLPRSSVMWLHLFSISKLVK
jgi:hypothetical protein